MTVFSVLTLPSEGIALATVKWHALTTRLLPLAITVGFGGFVTAPTRLGSLRCGMAHP